MRADRKISRKERKAHKGREKEGFFFAISAFFRGSFFDFDSPSEGPPFPSLV